MKDLILIFCLFFNLSIQAQSPIQLFDLGNEAYNQGLYEKAKNFYVKVLDENLHSAELYFNLGNSYYKTGEIAESIFYLELANRLSPGQIDIKNNIKFAKNMGLDSIEELPKSQIYQAQKKFLNIISIDSWSIISLLFSWLFCILFGVYIWSQNSKIKRVFFILSSLIMIFLLTSISMIYNIDNSKKQNNSAIIFEKKINVNSEPNNRSTLLFNLHEGTMIEVTEKLDDWLKIKIANGSEGWIENKNIRFLNYNRS